METCTFCGTEYSSLVVLQIEKLVLICRECVQTIEKRNKDIDKYTWSLPQINKNNDVCKKCFLSEPSFFKVTFKKLINVTKLTKVCNECKSLVKKKECSCAIPLFCHQHFKAGTSVVFIKIKWRKYLKSRNDLKGYNHVTAETRKLKQVFKNKNEDVEKLVKKIEDIRNGLKKNVRNSILEKKSQIENYKDQVKTLFFGISKQIKEHELIGEYSKYYRLLESTDIRENFFSQKLMETQKVNYLKNELEERFCIKLPSLSSIFN